MGSTEDPNVERWIRLVEHGDEEAIAAIWDLYSNRLEAIARKYGADGVAEGAEDVVISAFKSYWRGATQGRFRDLKDGKDLAKLLVAITIRKACDQYQRNRTKSRGGGLVKSESELDAFGGIDGLPSLALEPALHAEGLELIDRLLIRLPDENHRIVVIRSLEGYTQQEIADELKLVRRSVANYLARIRAIWQREVAFQ
jgi:RNA polymerase sigma factor (sigma-70 family)